MDDIQRTLENGLTVGQLREMLEDFDDDAPVLFACNYGDYHNTQQALPVESVDEYETRDLGLTAYSRSGIHLLQDDVNEDDDADPSPIVVLR